MIEHPPWCAPGRCTATEHRGAHHSAVRTVVPHEGEHREFRVDLQQSVLGLRYRPVVVLHVLVYDVEVQDEPIEVVGMTLRQGFLLARAVDGLLTQEWYPRDGAPEGGEPR
jgi:hypothetical protein